jgi:hypothetical protein
MKTTLLLSFLLLLSCSTKKLREKQLKSWESWNGRNVSEIEEHPYFKNIRHRKQIKHDDGSETWLFKDQTPVQTGAYCQSLGGCTGMPIYNCENAFSIKDGIVQGFEQKGTCPELTSTAALKR